MKFSILITSFNKGKYLEECINSCLNQTNKNFEIIICDNYSTDNTKQKLEKYKDSVKIIKKKKISDTSPENQIDLIKVGFINSCGDIICLLDADDYFYPNKLEVIEKELNTKFSLDVIFDLPMKKKLYTFNKLILKNKKQKYIWPTIINTSSISVSKFFLAECIKKDVLEKFSLLEIDFRLNVYSRCIKKNFIIINQDITVYRQVPNSIMSNIKKYSAKWWRKRLEAHKFMEKHYNKNNLLYLNKLDYCATKLLSKILN